MNTTKWMKPTRKGRIPTTQYSGKSKKINSCQEGRAGQRIFRACEKTVYETIIVNTHHLYMCNPQNVQHQEWTLVQVMESRWLWYVNVGSSVELMYHSDNGLSMCGARKHLGTLFFLCNYAMNLKFLSGEKKKESTKKRKMRVQGEQYLISYPGLQHPPNWLILLQPTHHYGPKIFLICKSIPFTCPA